jgi:ribonuclease T2
MTLTEQCENNIHLQIGLSDPRNHPMASSSLRSLLAYAGGLFSQLPGAPQAPSDVRPFYEPLSGAPSCPIDGPTSCSNSTPVAGDSCCFVHPGGRLLLTQFWDQKVHAGGAEDDWTLHGLWCVLSAASAPRMG